MTESDAAPVDDTDDEYVDLCTSCGRPDEECNKDPDQCGPLRVKRIYRMALESKKGWKALLKGPGSDDWIKAGKETGSFREERRRLELFDEELAELLDADDYVFAHGDGQVLMVGTGEDGVYTVERPITIP
jgi:hypothetical protein